MRRDFPGLVKQSEARWLSNISISCSHLVDHILEVSSEIDEFNLGVAYYRNSRRMR